MSGSTPKPSQHKIRKFNSPFPGSQSNGTGKPAARGPSYAHVGSRQARAGPAEDVGSPSGGGGAGDGAGDWYGWEVQWRVPQARKNKSWESDGYLILNGTKGTLRDEDGKVIGTSSIMTVPTSGSEIKVAGKDVLLDSEITRANANQLFGSGQGGAIPPSPAAASAAYAAATATATARSTPQPTPRSGIALPPPTPYLQKMAAQARSQAASPLTKQPVEADAEDDDAGRPAKKRRAPEQVSDRLSTTPVAADQAQSPEAGMNIDNYLDQEKPIDFTTSDFDIQPAPPPPPIVKPKATKPAFTGLKPSGPIKSKQLDEVDEQAYYYTGQYRKPQTKKHKTWDGDGILVVQGRAAKLHNGENGQVVAEGRADAKPFEVGQLVRIGSKEMEIDGTIDERFFNSGECFTKGFVPSAAVPKGARAPHAVPARPSTAPPSSVAPTPTEQPRKKFKPLQPTAAPTDDPIAALTAPITNDSFYKSSASTVPVPGAHVPGAKAVDPRHDPNAPGAVVLPRPSTPAVSAHRKSGQAIVDVVIDPTLARALRPHQIEGVKFMYEAVMGMRLEAQGCILADEMGLGKTVQAITLIYTLLKQSAFAHPRQAIQRAVIVCPVTLCQNWRAEFTKWLGRDRIQVVVGTDEKTIQQWRMSRSSQVLIIGYERLSSMTKLLKGNASYAPVGLIICDEGHRLKGKQSKINQALNQFTDCKMRIILSGTPVQNNLTEFHTMVDWICPGILDDYKVFKTVYEVPILNSRAPDADRKTQKLGQERSDKLNEISSKFMLRRTGDVIAKFLPPKLEYTVLVIPTPLEIALHAAILKSKIAKDITNGFGGQQQLSLLTLLRKLCNSPGLIWKAHKDRKQLDILTDKVMSLFPEGRDPNEFALSGKMMMLGALLRRLYSGGQRKGKRVGGKGKRAEEEDDDEEDEEEEGPRGREKIVVVSNFTSTLDVVEAHCSKSGYTFCRLDGSTPQNERVKMVNLFNKGSDAESFIFLLSSKSGGVGLNIIGASRLVLIDSDWNPSNDLQAMARIHREGQKRQCVIYRLLTAGTMDEKVFQRQVTKLGLSGSVMSRGNSDQGAGAGAAAEMGAGGAKGKGGGDSFTYEELKAVFTLHPKVACQTHELLGCRCHLGEEQVGMGLAGGEEGAPSSDWQEGEEEETEAARFGSFAPASQLPDTPEVNPAEAARKLSVLQDWVHHDGCAEASVDLIEDRLLRDVIYYQAANASRGEQGFETEQFARWREAGGQKEDGKGMMVLRGGMVGFAFAKRSAGEEDGA